ncbi:MAG: DUF1289 domain-containing protein [Hyphomicrobiaceae bacterium]
MSNGASAATAGSGRRLPPSPCVGICTMDDASGFCCGCGRTGPEISEWPQADAVTKQTIWRALPGRLAALDVTTFRLAAEPEDVAAFVATTLRSRAGRWLMGATGASASFVANADTLIHDGPGAVTALNESGNALRILKHDRVRAFGATIGQTDGRMRAVVLALPRGRAELEPCIGVSQKLGDEAAIRVESCTAAIFDLATQRRFSRLSIRLRDRTEMVRFVPFLGRPFEAVRKSLCALTDGVDIIAETALGRIELTSPDSLDLRPMWANDCSVEERSSRADALELIDLPQAFAACAVFYADDPEWLAGQLTS